MGVQSERLGCVNPLLWKLSLVNIVTRQHSSQWFPATDQLVNGRHEKEISAAFELYQVRESLARDYMLALQGRRQGKSGSVLRPNSTLRNENESGSLDLASY